MTLLGAQQVFVRSRLRAKERIEAELRASEAKFSGILAIAADAIITVDQSQRIVHFNSGAERIFGYKTSDAIGRHLAILIPPRFRGAHDAHIESFARSSVTARRMGERREIFGLRSDGTEFPAEASISKLVTPDGLLFTVVLRDTTVPKRTEENERFLSGASGELSNTLAVDATERAIVDLPIPRLADAALLDLVDPQGAPGGDFKRVASTRQRAELTSGVQALAAHRLSPDSPAPIVDVIRRGRLEHVEVIDDEWLESSADPEAAPHWRAIGAKSILVLPLVAGDTRGALTLIRAGDARPFDQDQRALGEKFARVAATALQNAHLYEAARHANRARDEVLGVVSHDLRNPLSAISMCARVLEESPPGDDADRRELLATIRESTDWMNRLIEDLLDVSNIERGRLSLEVRPEEPSQIALQALHMFEVEAKANAIALEARLPTNMPLVAADRSRVVQVLSNLLRNAIKFTPRDGRIEICAEARDRNVVFSVTDTGLGIGAEKQARVFDRYWQASAGARQRGAGLGLSIAKGIVEAHGGRIWVRSVPGEGSEFAFTIPQAEARSVRREEP
ncbi:MAG TPA: ATP-binding protein [Gemmatimonadaceae bacterium]